MSEEENLVGFIKKNIGLKNPNILSSKNVGNFQVIQFNGLGNKGLEQCNLIIDKVSGSTRWSCDNKVSELNLFSEEIISQSLMNYDWFIPSTVRKCPQCGSLLVASKCPNCSNIQIFRPPSL